MNNFIPIRNGSDYISFSIDRALSPRNQYIFSSPFTCYVEKQFYSTYNFSNRYPGNFFKIDKSNHYIGCWTYIGFEKLDYNSYLYRKTNF